ncbi:MAG: zf-HC2 domain-containing protein [Gaiellaceae bacterium]
MAGREPLMWDSVCERAREWSSLRLDGELSVLEEELLERHLGVCELCADFEDGMRTTAGAMRAAPVERPSRRTRIPARRAAGFSTKRRRTAVVAAAALALGALLGSYLDRPPQPAPVDGGSQISLLSRDLNQLRDLPREAPPARPAPVPSGPPNPPEGVI